MTSVRFKGFVGNSYLLRNSSYDCQRLVNMYVLPDESQLGRNGEIAQLVRTPGLTQLVPSNDQPGKCVYKASDGNLYYATNIALYKIIGNITSTWSSTFIGWITLPGPVQISDNGTYLFIVSAGVGYSYNMSTGVIAPITGVNPNSTTYFDGYVVFSNYQTNKFYWTDLYSTSVNGLNFASAEANADKIVGLINNNEDLWIFGEKTTELWYDAGTGNVVFQRRPGILIETGCAAANTVQKITTNRLMWLAVDDRSSPYVVMAIGYTVTKVSTFAQDQAWANLTAEQIAGATAYTYMQDGSMFYVLNIPGTASTWVFDVTTSDLIQAHTWHERATYSDDNIESRHWAESHVYHQGKHVVCDYRNGAIYFYDVDGYTDNGTLIRRVRVSPHLSNSGTRMFYDSLTIDFKVGVGNSNTPDPQIMLEYSNDGGKTWSNQLFKSVGNQGSFSSRVIFRQLGLARDRVFKLTLTDPVDWAISGASLDLRAGSS